MKPRFEFLRLISKVERGGYARAIIVWDREPWLMKSVTLNDEERKKKGYTVENRVVQYRYYLGIDLWIVRISFTWTGLEASKQK